MFDERQKRLFTMVNELAMVCGERISWHAGDFGYGEHTFEYAFANLVVRWQYRVWEASFSERCDATILFAGHTAFNVSVFTEDTDGDQKQDEAILTDNPGAWETILRYEHQAQEAKINARKLTA